MAVRLSALRDAPSSYQVEGTSSVGCPHLFIQYIPSYPQYVEAVFFILNLRSHHSLV
jgi:hypothetical protein